MIFYVYIIRNHKGQFYKGMTGDLHQRISYHNSGKSPWTRNKGPWDLVYYEEYGTKSEAIKREKFLKTGKGREFLKSVIGA